VARSHFSISLNFFHLCPWPHKSDDLFHFFSCVDFRLSQDLLLHTFGGAQVFSVLFLKSFLCTLFNDGMMVVKRVQGKQQGIVSWRKSVKRTKIHSWFIPVNARDVTHDQCQVKRYMKLTTD
jgi:hypothetical protein